MSQEVLQMIKGMDLDNVRTQLALQCAPVLSGVKMSNLLIISNQNESYLHELIKDTDLIYFKVLQTENKTTYLLFWREMLQTYLLQKEVIGILYELGYHNMHLGYILRKYAQRYMSWSRGNSEFPHEMGLLLGYPIDDVEGFIQHQGKNYLYSGYWKVYGRVEEKKRLFSTYEMATTKIMQMMYQGMSVKEVIIHFQEKVAVLWETEVRSVV